ncbi:MAG TPA: phage portal protein [Bacteroidales bacterium]|nr:phage portal protein [Bacteroidales bacterium]
MNLFTRAKNILTGEKRSITVQPTTAVGLPYGFAASPLSIQNSLQLSAVYRCVDVVSDSIASQTWDILRFGDKGWRKDEFHYAWETLNLTPGPAMNKYTFMKTLVQKVLLEGDGFIIIHRDGTGQPDELELVIDTVTMYQRQDRSVYYFVGKPGFERKVEDEDMIHVLNFSYDGLRGVSTLRHAANSMSLSYSAEASARGFFASGANLSGILSSDGKITTEKATSMKDSWRATFNVASGEPGGVAVLDGGLKFLPVTVNPKDQQLIEVRGFNVVDICRFFGVPPAKAFDNANLTYSNVEAYQLGYLTDTVSPFNTKLEVEFNRKVFPPRQRRYTWLQLNINELIRANMDSKINYLSKGFQVGGFTINELRQQLDNPPVEGGDQAYYQVNMQPVGTKPIDKTQKQQ